MNMTEILTTVKDLRKRYEAIKANYFALKSSDVCHLQIAERRIDDAELFSGRNDEYSEKCLWEAQYHLSLTGGD